MNASADNRKYVAALSLAALGVVYGDIGTSPLYALKETFHHGHGVAVTPANIMGAISLIFWALVIVITVKYVAFVLRADNRGEGGILALTALVTPVSAYRAKSRGFIILLGLFGTALLFGDGMITPAISVLSAIEGLNVVTPVFSPYVVPLTIAILIALFSVQSRGTASVGRIFGPVTLLWFITLAALGIGQIVQRPEVLQSLWPGYAMHFFLDNQWFGFLALGSIFLVVTGGEALYSDLGHFGIKPIRLAWFAVVFPALLLNYLGQGALLLRNPAAIENPFYHMAPQVLLIPLVIIATCATVVASQALITGVFSLTRMAAQLGYAPRVAVQHTSPNEIGQIYIARVNTLLLISCIGLVLGFQTSSNLAAAYGVAVTTTMVITTIIFYIMCRERWHWPRWKAITICGFFLIIDLGFWTANLVKIPHGGWFPLLIGFIGFGIMTTWKDGRNLLAERLREKILTVDDFVTLLTLMYPTRLPGVGIYLSSSTSGAPPTLFHTLDHFQAVHETLVILSIKTLEVPHVAPEERLAIADLGQNVYRVSLNYGFMEDPDVPIAIEGLRLGDTKIDAQTATYVLGRENLVPTRRKGMAFWREHLFTMMSQNARSAADYFRLPTDRVVELGIRIEL